MNSSSYKQLEPCYILRPLGYYLVFIWIIGTYLNGSVLYIFIRNKKLRQSTTNLFIGGLILADFIGACFEIPLPAIALLNCRWFFSYFGCVLEAFIAYFAGCSNMFMLCVISIDRYIVITKPFASKNITVKQAYIIILCAYLFSLFWTLMPVIGWSSYDYEGTGVSCSIKWEDRSFNVISYNVAILVFVYLVPVSIILLTNIHVFKMIRCRRVFCRKHLNEPYLRRRFSIERRIAYTVVFIIGGFLLAWTPYAIASVIQMFVNKDHFPPILGTIPAIFAKSGVVWNPIIYVIRNGNFRFYLPFYPNHRLEQRSTKSNSTRYSIYPYPVVHLPLPSRPSFREL